MFRDPYRFKKRTELFIAAEGIHTGQFIYCGKKGNALSWIGQTNIWAYEHMLIKVIGLL